MRLGVLSDTHGHVHNTLAAIRMLQSLEVEAVLHCGDIGSPSIPALFEDWPTHFVLGNVDLHDQQALGEAVRQAGQHFHDRFADLTLDQTRIALLHSDEARRFHETIESGVYDLVCYGHTHQAKSQQHGSTLVLNPGALYRAARHSIALVELPERTVEFVQI